MPAPHELVLDLPQFSPHPLGDRDALEHEAPVLALRAAMRESQEIERLRLAQTTARPVTGGEPPELDQPGLVGLKLQDERRELVAKIGEELTRIRFALETHQMESRRRESHPPALA